MTPDRDRAAGKGTKQDRDPASRQLDARFALVLGCFALSGFAGLLYETAWTREFSFVFGTSSLAVSTVLAAYMGGLAAGAAIAGRFVSRVRRPVLVYGLLELGIAASALAIPHAIDASRLFHGALLRGVTDPGSPFALGVDLTTSFVILCVPTTLMGATLPLLARHAIQTDEQIGPRIGALYSINTLGAILGTLVTAFVLMPALGLRHTVYLGAAVNALVFFGAWGLARRDVRERKPGGGVAPADPRDESKAGDERAQTDEGPLDPTPRTRRIVLAIAGLAGVASFTYEVFWFRLIEHVLGASVYAFAAMLSSFLLGIALGGAAAAAISRFQRDAMPALAFSQLGAAAFALLGYRGLMQLPLWIQEWGLVGGMGNLLKTAAIVTLILLPSTLCLGALLPFAVRALSPHAALASLASAQVYSWNTLGAIVGSLASGFFLLPRLGFAGTLLVASALNGTLALAAWSQGRMRSRLFLVAAFVVLATTLLSPPPVPWTLLRSAPAELAQTVVTDDRDVVFHAIGRSASVLATRDRAGIRIRTNGLPESLISLRGSRPGKTMTARWLGVIPALARRPPSRLLVIGLGGGVALEAIPATIRQIDVVELEPEVVAANDAVASMRAIDVAEDDRISISIGDARRVLDLSEQSWDAIVSQPSHPWTAGSSHLYTRDFFERVRRRLAPEGLLVQWLGLNFVDDALLRSFAATLSDVFPHVRFYRPEENGGLFVASIAPLELETRVAILARSAPEVLPRVGIDSAARLAAALVLDESAIRTFAGGARLISDDFNSMATRAPLLDRQSAGIENDTYTAYDPIPSGRFEWIPPARLVEALVDLERSDRALALVDALPDGPSRELAHGILDLSRGRFDAARTHFAAVPRDVPESREAEWQRLRLDVARAIPDTLTRAIERFAQESDERAVLRAWSARARGDHAEIVALDARLAAIAKGSPTHADAIAIRIAWRLRDPTRERAAEALALIDTRVRGWNTAHLADRAYAAALAGDAPAALDSVVELAHQQRRLAPRTVRLASAALAALPSESIEPERRRSLRRRLERMRRR